MGGNRKRTVSARIIAATNLDLKEAVTNGGFRQDLFFRLNVISIAVPPLRERPDDILPLFHHFLDLANKKTGKRFSKISAESQKLILEHDWPGNIRELGNTVERIALLESGDTILPEFLPFAAAVPAKPAEREEHPALFKGDLDYDKAKRHLIEQALQQSNGNITRAAQLLKMAPHKLRYRIKKIGIII